MLTVLAHLVVGLVMTLAVSSCSRDVPPYQADSTQIQEPVWVVDPDDPGNDAPPVGRSLFDYLVTEERSGTRVYNVPVPFTALVDRIERELGAQPQSPLKRVLIPLNRSLQRRAAAPSFFAYPRAVIGLDTESPMQAGSSGMLLKDRLFLGYQETANLIEVISYNETAGRFEFQVVRDYRPGGTPQVRYANRALCTLCHQNQSPIFARPLWEETNANPKVATLLRRQQRGFYGFPIDQGVDVPNALDEATDRANEFSASQLLWQEGCERPSLKESIDCRADILRLLLQYRLTGGRGFDTRSPRYTDHFRPGALNAWQSKWPKGLRIPNPDIPNRNPFDFPVPALARMAEAQPITHGLQGRPPVRSIFEPSVRREPLAVWSILQNPDVVNRVITGLSHFLAEADIRRLDAHLFRESVKSGAAESRYEARCIYSPRRKGFRLERLVFQCSGTFSMEGLLYLSAGTVEQGAIDHLSFDGDDLADLGIAHGAVTGKGLHLEGRLEVVQNPSRFHARHADGRAVKVITFRIDGPARQQTAGDPDEYTGAATVTVLEDFTPVHQAIDAMARETVQGASDVFARLPFRRARVMGALYRQIQMPPLTWCCVEDRGMPAPVLDFDPNTHGSHAHDDQSMPVVKTFHRYCAQCHHGEDLFPPSFLHGSPAQVRAQVDHCAERILFRLDMWELPPSERPETPMPPVSALRRLNVDPDQWTTHEDFATLRKYASDAMKSHLGGVSKKLVGEDYDGLPSCLPPPRPWVQAASGSHAIK